MPPGGHTRPTGRCGGWGSWWQSREVRDKINPESVLARVFPNQLLIYTLVKEIGVASIAIAGDATIRRTDVIPLSIVYDAGDITTMGGDEIDDLTIIFVAPNRQGRIADRVTFELLDQLIDPGGGARLGG